MKAIRHVLWVAGIGFILLAQSCISVQSMRYRHGLNIQLSRVKDEKPANKKLTISTVKRKHALPEKDPNAWPSGAMGIAGLESKTIESPVDLKVQQATLQHPSEHAVINAEPSASAHHVNLKAPLKWKHGIVATVKPYTHTQLNKETDRDDPEPVEDVSVFSILIRAIAGTFIGVASAALLLLSIVLGPILYIIAVFLAFILSYFGIKAIKQGWQMAKERTLGLKLLYILLSIPGFIICGTIYLITLLIFESAGFDLD